MADTTPSLAPAGNSAPALAPPLSDLDKQRDQAAAKYYEEGSSKIAAEAEQKSSDRERQLADASATYTGKEAELTKPTPAPQYHGTDPIKMWGSIAMIFAGLASLRTRTPMNTALNAAAATIKAYHANDLEAYNREYQKWQASMQESLREAEYTQKSYEHIVAEINRAKGLDERDRADKLRDLANEAHYLAIGNHDDIMNGMIAEKGALGVADLQLKRQELTERIRRDTDANAEKAGIHKLELEMQASPEYKEADVTERLAMWADLHRAIDPKFSFMTAGQKAALEYRMATDLQTKGVGKAEVEAGRLQPIVEAARQDLAAHGEVQAQHAASFIEASQRILNNQAVRISMVNLQISHMPLIDKARAAANALDPRANTAIPGPQAEQLLGIMDSYRRNLDKIHAEEIKIKRNQAIRMGLDPDNVAPDPGLESGHAHGMGGNPKFDGYVAKLPQAAVSDLKEGRTTAKDFDAWSGKPGLGEYILSKGGSTGHGSSGTFSASQ